MSANPWWLRQAAGTNPALRLICFPYAGGGASLYRDWQAALPEPVEVIAVQLPGRETRMREAPIADLAELLPRLVSAMQPLLDRDFALFGHSMGALIAFEFARELSRHRLPQPRQLWVSGHRAPQLPRQRRRLHDLPQAEFVAELRRLKGTPEEILAHPELMELLSPRLRADFALCENWRYRDEAPLDCALTAYAGVDDELDDSRLDAWSTQTRGRFGSRRFPGGHFFLHAQRDVLLACLRKELTTLLAPPTPTQSRRAHA